MLGFVNKLFISIQLIYFFLCMMHDTCVKKISINILKRSSFLLELENYLFWRDFFLLLLSSQTCVTMFLI